MIQPGSFTGAGIALTYNVKVPLPQDTPYVVSAFIRRPLSEGSLAHIYLDGGQTGHFDGFSAVNTSAATTDWQFVWGVFESPHDTTISPRIVLDFNVANSDVVYVDQFALTPYSQFITPDSLQPDQEPGAIAMGTGPVVPEPAVTWSLLGMTLPAFVVSKWIRRNRRA
ncbi:MAG TPA: hypothetical protein VMB21_20980 [Candidatus Limnocylindria bacterium]|nr:hypothetical protein [Candidatus Limnocylindria bacterium]